jgi:hypothetical protein
VAHASSSLLIARPSSLRSHSIGIGAARPSTLPEAEESTLQWLHEHLIRDHGRTGPEIDGLSLADLHHFEHLEQELGLIDLGHRHPADVVTPHVSPADLPITAAPGNAAGSRP